MRESYLAALSKFALRPTVDIADGSAVILAALVPLGYTFLGKQMPDSAFQVIGTMVGVLIVSAIIVRAITAPYFVWKEQCGRIESLESEVNKPDQLIRGRVDQRIADSRIELAGYVVRLRAAMPQKREQLDEYMKSFTHNNVQELVSHLAYVSDFKALWEEFKNTLFDTVRFAPENPKPSLGYQTYQQTQELEKYREREARRYFDRAEKRIDAIQEKLVNHLMMKS